MDSGQVSRGAGEASQAAGGGQAEAKPRRMLWLWIGTFGFLGAVVAFCWLLLRPVLQVQETCRHMDCGLSYPDAIQELGGQEAAARKLDLCSRLPAKFAPNGRRVLESMGWCGSNAVSRLLQLLTSHDPETRAWAAAALGRTNDRRAVEPLAAALQDPDEDVSHSAALSLGELGDSRAVEPLISAMNDASWNFGRNRDPAVIVLGELRDKRAVDALIAVLRDQAEPVRYHAACSLGKIGDERAIPALDALAEGEPNKRETWGARGAIEEIRAAMKQRQGPPK